MMEGRRILTAGYMYGSEAECVRSTQSMSMSVLMRMCPERTVWQELCFRAAKKAETESELCSYYMKC